jgi:S-adenosylmethionine:tRNA ribosyltransferase-isomerase
MEDLLIADYDYGLPNDRIAAFPLAERDASRLLVYQDGTIADHHFRELSHFLPPCAVLVANNTRVIEARIFFQKQTGGFIELFCLEPHEPAEMVHALQATQSVQWRCLVGGASKWKPGQVLIKEVQVDGAQVTLEARYVERRPDDFVIAFTWAGGAHFADILHAAGNIPLPPYIKREVQGSDAERYQTIFAKNEGSVAAPTAALHFTNRVFADLDAKNISRHFITLNVGAGTFKPVKTETLSAHAMHPENFSVTASTLQALINAPQVIATGTTTLRTLESLYWLGVKTRAAGSLQTELGQWEAYEFEGKTSYRNSLELLVDELSKSNSESLNCRTSLLIRPGYSFRSADALITNFHQPRSTLILLVAAFIGEDWRRVYEHAMNGDYRFLSYGDSSLLWRRKP